MRWCVSEAGRHLGAAPSCEEIADLAPFVAASCTTTPSAQ
jgi:hypothetical protein